MSTLRRATPSDASDVTALWLALTEWHAQQEPLFALAPGGGLEARRLVEAQLRDPDTAIFLADGGEGVVGLCIVRVDRAPPVHEETRRAEITDLFVRPAARRAGCGSALVRRAQDWGRERGAPRVLVRVSARNEVGRAFWEAQGFGDFMDVLHRRL